MVLIPCNAECKHQQEGYCTLDTISHVTNAQGTCAYYRHKGIPTTKKAPSEQTEGADSSLK